MVQELYTTKRDNEQSFGPMSANGTAYNIAKWRVVSQISNYKPAPVNTGHGDNSMLRTQMEQPWKYAIAAQ